MSISFLWTLTHMDVVYVAGFVMLSEFYCGDLELFCGVTVLSTVILLL